MHAVEARIDVVQVRERDLETVALAALVGEALAMTRGTKTRLVVNDRLDVALAVHADGVHLRGDSMPPSAARSLAPPGFLVGRSIHSAWEAIEASSATDYVIAGTVWASPSKPERHPLIGVRGLAGIVRATKTPVVAIGGITVERAAEVAAAGAAGVAGVGLFMRPGPKQSGGCRTMPLVRCAAAVRARFDTFRSAS